MQEQVNKLEARQDRLEDTVNRLVLQIDKLVGAFDRTYEADHKIDLTLQLLNSKVEAMLRNVRNCLPQQHFWLALKVGGFAIQ